MLILVSIKDLNEAVNKDIRGLDEGLYTSETYQDLDALGTMLKLY
ncbi:MAG: hypothetical protein V8R64_10635 [Thomasclavelia sp.]